MMFWCAYGAFFSFATSLFRANGMSPALVGAAVAMQAGCGLLGQLALGYLCDRLRTNRRVFLGCAALSMALCLGVYAASASAAGIVLFGLLGFTLLAARSILDTWVMKCFSETPGVFGGIRAWGSYAYALLMTFYGGMLARYGYGLMPVFATAFLALCILLAAALPDAPPASFGAGARRRGKAPLFRNGMPLVLAVTFFTGVGLSPLMQLMPLVLEPVGGGVAHQSAALFWCSLAEAVCMTAGARCLPDPRGRLRLSAALGLVTLAGLALAPSPLWVVAFCGLRGCAYGLFLPALRQKIQERASAAYQTTCQGMADAVYNCLSIMAGSLLFGGLAGAGGIGAALGVGAGLQLAAMALLLLL